MTLLHLRYFCVVAKHESISKAAEELMVSQPALSKVIKSLEDELGCPLFYRSGRSIRLSQAGQLFYESVSRSLSILDDAVSTVSVNSVSREIHICINVADLFMEDMIAEYYHMYNDISFVVTNSEQPEPRSFVHDNDLSVFTARSTDTTSPLPKTHILFSERFGLCVPADDPLAGERSVSLLQAKNRRFLGTSSYGVNHSFCLETGFSPNIVIVGQNLHTYLKMLECGYGVSILPEISLGRYLPSNCVFVPLSNPVRMRTVAMAENPMKESPIHVRKFRDYCLERCALLRREYPNANPDDVQS